MVEVGIYLTMVLLVMAIILDIIINKLNPTPRMKDDHEENIFINNVKTRRMYEYIKK